MSWARRIVRDRLGGCLLAALLCYALLFQAVAGSAFAAQRPGAPFGHLLGAGAHRLAAGGEHGRHQAAAHAEQSGRELAAGGEHGAHGATRHGEHGQGGQVPFECCGPFCQAVCGPAVALAAPESAGAVRLQPDLVSLSPRRRTEPLPWRLAALLYRARAPPLPL